MEIKELSEHYQEIGNQLIQTQPELAYLKGSTIKIAYLCSDQLKKEGRDSKLVYAETEIIPGKYKWGIEADAAITIYRPNAAVLNDRQRQILIFQQLLKIGVNVKPDAEEQYVLNEYDVTDFKVIVKKYGADWAETQKDLFEEETETIKEVENNTTSLSDDINIFE